MRNDFAGQPEMAEARNLGLLNIGEAAQETGVSAKSIRHYEAIGLMPPAHRTYANYRLYSKADLQSLRFIKQARVLGFSTEKIRELLGLWQDRNRSSADVKTLALQHIAELEQQIRELETMRNTLRALANDCHGDERPECPILEDMANSACCAPPE